MKPADQWTQEEVDSFLAGNPPPYEFQHMPSVTPEGVREAIDRVSKIGAPLGASHNKAMRDLAAYVGAFAGPFVVSPEAFEALRDDPRFEANCEPGPLLPHYGGFNIIPSPMLPMYVPRQRLSDKVQVSDEFRADFDAWLADFFGCDEVGGFMVTPPFGYEPIRAMDMLEVTA